MKQFLFAALMLLCCVFSWGQPTHPIIESKPVTTLLYPGPVVGAISYVDPAPLPAYEMGSMILRLNSPKPISIESNLTQPIFTGGSCNLLVSQAVYPEAKPVMGSLSDSTLNRNVCCGYWYLDGKLMAPSNHPVFDGQSITYAVMPYPNTGPSDLYPENHYASPKTNCHPITEAGNAKYRCLIGDGYIAEFSGKAITNRAFDKTWYSDDCGTAIYYKGDVMVAMSDALSGQISVFDDRYNGGYIIYCDWFTGAKIGEGE